MVRNKNSRSRWVYVGLGMILGFFCSNLCFLQFGVNGLWFLSVFGVGVLILGFVHVYGSSSRVPVEPVDMDDNDDKSLLKKMRIWR